jgi:hypothetical protein
MPYYVTMTDKFMSGWGLAEGKINKLVFICDSLEEAKIVARNARKRGDQKYVNISANKPYYNKKKYYVQFKTKKEYPDWYKEEFDMLTEKQARYICNQINKLFPHLEATIREMGYRYEVDVINLNKDENCDFRIRKIEDLFDHFGKHAEKMIIGCL